MKKPRVSIIVAMANNRVIGRNNQLPWHLSEDLKHFRALTMGHHIVMGRKTYDSIGRPLPGRTTVIVTRNPDYFAADTMVVNSVHAAINAAHDDDEVFIIGGAEIIRYALPIANRIYLTEIKKDFEGDTYFPVLDMDAWKEVARESHRVEGPEGFEYHFVTYDRDPFGG